MTSEEILLEKIKKEREELKKQLELNALTFEKSKLFMNKPLPPTPLTILKPFNLSSNNSKLLMKKRMVSVNNSEINNKITEHMRKKCENHGIKESVFINNKIIYNKTPTELKFMSRFERSSKKSPIKKMTFSFENITCEKQNKNTQQEDGTITDLSSRIEKYCNISRNLDYMNNKKYLSSDKSNKSLMRSNTKAKIFKNAITEKFQHKDVFHQGNYTDVCLNSLENMLQNNNISKEKESLYNKSNDIFNNYSTINLTGNNDPSCYDNIINLTLNGATSIRKSFANDKNKENNLGSNNFKARPIKKGMFHEESKKNVSTFKEPEIISFNSILEQSKHDKFLMDKIEREEAKREKINQHKISKLTNKNTLVTNTGFIKNRHNKTKSNREVKKNTLIKSKLVDFNDLNLMEN